MVDRALITRLLNNLHFYLSELNKKKGVTLEEYLDNYDIQAIIERRMQEAIETCIDIANHIIANKNLRMAKSYRDAFLVLKENKILSKKIYSQLSDLASFRNILVHEYADIDAKQVYKKFKSSLKIFPQFMKIIKKL